MLSDIINAVFSWLAPIGKSLLWGGGSSNSSSPSHLAPEPNAAQQLQALSQHHAALRARLKSLARTQAEQLHALSQDLAALRTTLESCAEAQGEQQRILAALRHDCEQRFSQFAATLDAVQREAARQAALLRALAWLCSASLLACGGLSLWLALR